MARVDDGHLHSFDMPSGGRLPRCIYCGVPANPDNSVGIPIADLNESFNRMREDNIRLSAQPTLQVSEEPIDESTHGYKPPEDFPARMEDATPTHYDRLRHQNKSLREVITRQGEDLRQLATTVTRLQTACDGLSLENERLRGVK